MLPKKSSKANLEDKRTIFFQIGLVLALAFVFSAFEYKINTNKAEEIQFIDDGVIDELPPITRQQEKPLPKPPKVLTLHTEILELIDDDSDDEDVLELIDDEVTEDTEFIIVDEVEEIDDEPSIFIRVEQMPIFNPKKNATYEEGLRDLFVQMNRKVKYPVIAQENGIQGKVFFKFVVTEKGKVSNVQIVRSPDSALGKEAIRVVKSLPDFSPGMQRNKAVKVWYSGYLNFKLQ